MEYFLTSAKTIAEVSRDDYPMDSPREWDNLGTIITGEENPYFENESEFNTWDELIEHYGVKQSGTDIDAMYRDVKSLEDAALQRGDVLLPISIYEHSGMSIYVGMPNDHFDGRWDCSFEGFIMADDETIRKEFGTNDPTIQEKVKEILKGEIDTLDQALNGEVYIFTEYDRDGELIDSCGGFYTDDIANNFPFKGEIIEELGDYDSIEDCIEANQEKLGITIDPVLPLSERIHFFDEQQKTANDGLESREVDDPEL